MDRCGTHAGFRLSEKGVDVFRRHISRSRRISSEQPIPIKESKKVAIMPLVHLARSGPEMAGGPSALEPCRQARKLHAKLCDQLQATPQRAFGGLATWCSMWSFRINSRIGLVVEFDLLPNKFSELLGGRNGL